MDSTTEAEWPDEFTREETLEQQSNLLIEECRLLQQEVSRYRKNIAKLIDMHTSLAGERDKLRTELASATSRVYELQQANYEQMREIGSMKDVLDQHRAVMRQHKVPSVFFEYETTSDIGHTQGTSLKKM